jgi:hypothetical protein
LCNFNKFAVPETRTKCYVLPIVAALSATH